MAINRILCVDDEPAWRRELREHFQRELTPNVDVAENYESAMQLIRQNRYDLIILDGLEGDCFRIHQDIQEIPHGDVIIFSGNDKILGEAEKREIPSYDKFRAPEFLEEIVAKYKPTSP